MKKLLIIPMVVIIVASLTVKTAPQVALGTIQGTVVNDLTKEPIRSVQITVKAGSLPLQGIDENSMNILLNSSVVGVGPGVATGVDALRTTIEQSAARTGSPIATTTTDVGGHFTIPSLSPGSFIVTAILDGYFGPETNGRRSTVLQKQVKVAGGQNTDVTFPLVPGGTISGRVLDAMGMPAVEANVQMLRVSYPSGLAVLQIAASKTTDDRGDYRLYRLMPGTYYIAVIPRPVSVGNAASDGGNSNSSRETTVRTFFPRANEITEASPITLRGGDEIAGTDISLRIAMSAKISGKVLSSFPASEMVFVTQVGRGGITSSPTATLTLLAHDKNVPQDPSSARSLTISMSNPTNGHFDLSGIPPGLYDLYASLPDIKGYGPMASPGQAGSPVAFGRTTVDLRGEDSGEITVLVHHGSDIKGTVSVDGRPSPSVNNVRISLTPDDSSSKVQVYQQVGRFQPVVDWGGSFTIPAVPEAHYRFSVSFGPPLPTQTPMTELERALATAGISTPGPAPNSVPTAPTVVMAPSAYVADILQAGVSVYDNGISVGSDNGEPVQIVVKTDGGSIEGLARDSKQNPFAGATVVLVPQVRRRQNPALYRVSRTDDVGRFSMTAIPPGEYKLFAWENVPQGAYQNAEFIKRYEDRGTEVSVSANLRANTEVGLIQSNLAQ